MLGGLIATGATYLFPGGRALKLVKNGIWYKYHKFNQSINTYQKHYFNSFRLLCTSASKIGSSLYKCWCTYCSFSGKSESCYNRFSSSYRYRNLWKLLIKKLIQEYHQNFEFQEILKMGLFCLYFYGPIFKIWPVNFCD